MKNMVGTLVATALCCAPALSGQDDPAKQEQDKPQIRSDAPERDRDGMESFLEKHPGLRAKLKERADLNHDGKLSPRERAHARKLLKEKHEAWRKARRLKWLKEHPEQARKLRDRIDRDGDGVVERHEVRKAKRIKDRIDRDGDGVVERHEIRKAKRVKDRIDRDDDGVVDKKEVRKAKRVKDRLDRNDDGKVGPRERHRAKKKAIKRVRKRQRKG